MNEDVLSNLKSEFKLWGVKPEVNYTNSGHIELTWQASPDKPSRHTVIPKTGSDWRSWLNARAQIRRQLKADGLVLVEQIRKEAKPKPAILKALSIPEPIERDVDQIKMLRAEVSDLSELLLNMMQMVKELIAVTPPVEVPAFLPAAPPVEQIAAAIQSEFSYREPVKTRATNTKGIKAIDFISTSWSSTDALARDMGLGRVFALRKLIYLEKQQFIEKQGDRWRKKPEEPVVEMLPVIAKRKVRRLNGHHNH